VCGFGGGGGGGGVWVGGGGGGWFCVHKHLHDVCRGHGETASAARRVRSAGCRFT